MLHGMSPDGIALANTALVMSLIRGLIAKGLIDQADGRLLLNNAATLIEEDKSAFTKSRVKLSAFSKRNWCRSWIEPPVPKPLLGTRRPNLPVQLAPRLAHDGHASLNC